MQQLASGLWVEDDPASHRNGNGKASDRTSAQMILEDLEEQQTRGYRPTLPIESVYGQTGLPMYWLRANIESMITHPTVRQALRYFRGGIAGAEFWGGPLPDNPDDEKGLPISQDQRVAIFVKEQCERFWDRGVPCIQGFGYEYGYVGCENIYDDTDGMLKWEELHTFAPADTFLLTRDYEPVGVRVKNVRGVSKPVDLWMAGEVVPAKGMWYSHQPRYSPYFGESQLMGAWRPWRRLAWKDGAETVLDGAMYRFGYQGPVVWFPLEDLLSPANTPGTTQNTAGQAMKWSRDMARMIGEQYKAGGTIGLPSTYYANGQPKWKVELPTSMLAGLQAFIEACKYLQDQITSGIGVPPELLQAEASGSGYSGRRIPLEAFLANQQQIADALLRLFVKQVLRPLVRWNFGSGARFNVQVKSLIKSRTKDSVNAVPGAGPGQPGQSGKPAQPAPQPQLRQPEPRAVDAAFSHDDAKMERLREAAKKIARAA